MTQGGERIETEWGFWYDAEEGPEFWHGPWEGSPLAMWSTLALYVGALLLSMGLMPLRRSACVRLTLHAVRALFAVALVCLAVLAGDWDAWVVNLALPALLVLAFDGVAVAAGLARLRPSTPSAQADGAEALTDRGWVGIVMLGFFWVVSLCAG